VAMPSRTNGHAPEGAQVDGPSIGDLVSDATKHVSTLIQSEIELAKLELTSSVKNAGTGVGFFAGAVVLLVFSLTFLFISLAEGFVALGVPRWLAYFIVFLVLAIVVAVLVWMGMKKVKRVKAPERTIATSRETMEYLKKNTRLG
jgi:Putative Actinobacterial Holin-X, holin superfamily III